MTETSEAPAVSVVVCTRDRSASLARCLASLAAQEGAPGHEVVVVDSAPSDDAARRAAASFPCRYVREDRPGLDRARNRGIAEARGALVAFVDDDVEAAPGWLAALAAAFADPAIGGVTGRVLPAALDTAAQRLFEAAGGMDKGPDPRRFDRAALQPLARIRVQEIGVGANMAFRRAALAEIGGFDPGLDRGTLAAGSGDLDLFRRLLDAGKAIRYEPSAVVRHHHRREMDELARQLRENGRSYGVYLLKLWQGGGERGAVARVALHWSAWHAVRLTRGLLGRHPLPPRLLWQELRGALEAPRAWREYRRERRCELATPSPSGAGSNSLPGVEVSDSLISGAPPGP